MEQEQEDEGYGSESYNSQPKQKVKRRKKEEEYGSEEDRGGSNEYNSEADSDSVTYVDMATFNGQIIDLKFQVNLLKEQLVEQKEFLLGDTTQRLKL